MKLELLVEELRDISKKERLYHRTNFINLSEILDTGTVESSYYNLKGENHWGLCLGRKATFSDIDKGTRSYDEISENIGNVEFIFFEKRLGANKNLRGVKKNPVSEYGTNYGYALNRYFKKYYKENWAKKKKEFAKVFDKEIRTYAKEKNFRNVRPTQEKIDRFKEVDDEIFDIIFQMGLIMGSGREGEERLTSKKRFSLPLDSRFFKIKLLNGSYRNYRRFMEDYPSTRATKLCKNIYKYKDLFVKNDNFKKIVQDPDFKEAIGRRKLLKEEVLVEELRDIPRKNKLYHRTNLNALMGILKEGRIYSNFYKNNQDKWAVCLGRKATFSTLDNSKEERMLSENIGKVELIFFRDRIAHHKDLRGAKIKPVSEYNQVFKNNTKAKLRKVLGKYDVDKEYNIFKRIVSKYSSEIMKAREGMRELLKVDKKIIDDVRNKMAKQMKDETLKNLDNRDIISLLYNYRVMLEFTTNRREGEERIEKDKAFTIQLDERFIMIRFLPGIIREVELKARKIKRGNNHIYSFIYEAITGNNSDYFVKDREYKKLVSFLKDKIDEQ